MRRTLLFLAVLGLLGGVDGTAFPFIDTSKCHADVNTAWTTGNTATVAECPLKGDVFDDTQANKISTTYINGATTNVFAGATINTTLTTMCSTGCLKVLKDKLIEKKAEATNLQCNHLVEVINMICTGTPSKVGSVAADDLASAHCVQRWPAYISDILGSNNPTEAVFNERCKHDVAGASDKCFPRFLQIIKHLNFKSSFSLTGTAPTTATDVSIWEQIVLRADGYCQKHVSGTTTTYCFTTHLGIFTGAESATSKPFFVTGTIYYYPDKIAQAYTFAANDANLCTDDATNHCKRLSYEIISAYLARRWEYNNKYTDLQAWNAQHATNTVAKTINVHEFMQRWFKSACIVPKTGTTIGSFTKADVVAMLDKWRANRRMLAAAPTPISSSQKASVKTECDNLKMKMNDTAALVPACAYPTVASLRITLHEINAALPAGSKFGYATASTTVPSNDLTATGNAVPVASGATKEILKNPTAICGIAVDPFCATVGNSGTGKIASAETTLGGLNCTALRTNSTGKIDAVCNLLKTVREKLVLNGAIAMPYQLRSAELCAFTLAQCDSTLSSTNVASRRMRQLRRELAAATVNVGTNALKITANFPNDADRSRDRFKLLIQSGALNMAVAKALNDLGSTHLGNLGTITLTYPNDINAITVTNADVTETAAGTIVNATDTALNLINAEVAEVAAINANSSAVATGCSASVAAAAAISYALF